MENKDIIIVGLQPWDIEIGSNCKNIALELAKNNRVLYVNRALDRISSLKNRKDKKVQERLKSINGEIDDIEQKEENLWVLNPKVVLESVNRLPGFLFSYFNRINNKRLAVAINHAMQRLGFSKNLLFIDNDFFRAFYLPELLQVDFSIYYIRDFLIGQPYFKKHGAKMEQGLMRKVNMVTANSPYLADYAKKYNNKAYYIGQGCDFSLFIRNHTYSVPADISHLTDRPVIGYVGALIGTRLDINLLIRIAERRPEWNIILVGPEDKDFKESRLHKLPNVHFIGRKPQEQLPNYIYNFDVCINPQLINELTIGNYPRKIDEYLASGRPVVATYTDFMKSFAGFVYLCNNADEYIEAIESALKEDNEKDKNKRIDFALSHSWENSVNKLSDAYDSIINNG